MHTNRFFILIVDQCLKIHLLDKPHQPLYNGLFNGIYCKPTHLQVACVVWIWRNKFLSGNTNMSIYWFSRSRNENWDFWKILKIHQILPLFFWKFWNAFMALIYLPFKKVEFLFRTHMRISSWLEAIRFKNALSGATY